MQPTITATIEAIRDKIEQADYSSPHQIGDILIALSLITDVLEAQDQRIDAMQEYIDAMTNPYR